MYYLLIDAMALFFILIIGFKSRTFNNPITYYLLFWMFIVTVSNFNPFDFYSVSGTVYILVLLHIICFSLGYLFLCKSRNVMRKENKIEYEFLSYKRLKRLIMTLTVILIYYAIRYAQIASTVKSYELRMIKFQVGFLFRSGLEVLVYNYILYPMLILFVLYSIHNFISNNKVDVITMGTILSVILFGFIGLGRFIYFNAIMLFLLYYVFINKSKRNFNIKNVFFSIVIGVGAVWAIVYMYAVRLGMSISSVRDFNLLLSESLSQVLSYFIGPLRTFDYFVANGPEKVLFGRATFSGLEELMVRVFRIIGFDIYSANDYINDVTNNPIMVGENKMFNAFYTGLMNQYFDGGVIGIIFLSLILGIILSLIWNNYVKRFDPISLSLLTFSTLIVFSNIYRSELQVSGTFIVIFILLILQKRRKPNESFIG